MHDILGIETGPKPGSCRTRGILDPLGWCWWRHTKEACPARARSEGRL